MASVCSNRIKQLRLERGITQEELAARLGEETSIATVSRLESGRMTLTLPWMQRIGSALSVSPHDIIAEAGHGLRMLPIIGMIAAGRWSEAIEEPEGWIPVPDGVGGPRSFVLRPQGDSMNKLIDEEGGFIVVDPDQHDLIAGKIFAVRNLHGDTTFKRYAADPPRLEPMSSNSDHQPIPIGREPFTIIGRVTYVGREL